MTGQWDVTDLEPQILKAGGLTTKPGPAAYATLWPWEISQFLCASVSLSVEWR